MTINLTPAQCREVIAELRERYAGMVQLLAAQERQLSLMECYMLDNLALAAKLHEDEHGPNRQRADEWRMALDELAACVAVVAGQHGIEVEEPKCS